MERSLVAPVALIVGLLIAVTPPSARAHPLGNDNIEHFSVLYVLPDRFEVDYLVDINETPAGIIRGEEIDANHDDNDTVEEQNAWLDRKAQDFAPLLKATLDGEPIPLSPLTQCFDPKTGQQASACRMILKMIGFGGMPTYRLLIRYGGRYPHPLGGRPHRIDYADETFTDIGGLRRILLEETSLATTTAVKFDELREGPAPGDLKVLFDKPKIILSGQARLKSAIPEQWLVLDADQCYVLENTDLGLGLYGSPYTRIERPRPTYWNEGIDPFNYQQYDPAALPQEKQATVRFTLRNPCASGSAPAPVVAQAPPAGVSTAPAAGTAALPAFVSNWTDPRNNPAQAEKSYRQADTLVGMLQQFGQGRGLLLFLSLTGLAFIWGAGHALMPGHAKTVVAAYLISQRGTYWHAILLAIIVTITHTALVVIVGLIIYFYQKTHPNLGPRIQLWLGILAGVLVAIMGLTLIWRAVTGRIVHHHHDHDHAEPRSWWRQLFTHSHAHLPGHTHTHGHGHDHHHDHAHDHHHAHDHSHEHQHHGHEHPHVHTHVDEHGQVYSHSHAKEHEEHSHTHAHGHAHEHPHTHDHAHHHEHSHGHTHSHAHEHNMGGGHPARPAGETPAPHAEPISARMLLLLGITGGIVPCPTAMIILLLGIGANVVAWSLYAVGVFSLGLAMTLMAIGFLALASRRFASRLLTDAEHEGELSSTGQRVMFQLIPALSGTAVVILGCMIAANYLHALRVGRPLFPWLG